MKLWELRPAGTPAPDTVIGFVVRAETETAARMLAREEAGAEGGFVWLDDKLSTCVELLAEGDAGVIVADFDPA